MIKNRAPLKSKQIKYVAGHKRRQQESLFWQKPFRASLVKDAVFTGSYMASGSWTWMHTSVHVKAGAAINFAVVADTFLHERINMPLINIVAQ